MDSRKRILVEEILFTAMSAFHDIDNKQEREKYARDYFSGFCQRYDVDANEAYDMLNEMFEHKRTHTIFDYEHYKGDNLSQILLGEKSEKNPKPKVQKTPDER